MDSMERGGSLKPHVVITPFPTQGHLNTFLSLAKLLHSRGFHITYVNTEYNHKRLLKSRGPQTLDSLPDFRFETIPDGLPPSDADATQNPSSLFESTSKNCLGPFTNLLKRLNDSASNGLGPPVTSLVSDTFMTFTVKAAQEFGLPIAIFCPISAIAYLETWHSATILDKGIIPLKGMKNKRLRDLASYFSSLDPNDCIRLKFTVDEVQKAKWADAIIFNTFSELEIEALEALSSIFPALYTIGPVPLLLKEIPQDQVLDSIGSNMWKEETHCIQWLESQKPRSVVYVNFGSITVMSAEQVHEFAWGLANSKKHFLWIIRPDLVDGGSTILSPQFLCETKERGLIASWCEQEKVLNHRSIGGFLTHCGWNSMIESVCAGVPMACWPFFADQQTNCWHACNEWGIGLEIDNEVKREEVEKLVNELIEGDKGKEMSQKVLEWQKISKRATKSGGSSCGSLDRLIDQVLIKRKN